MEAFTQKEKDKFERIWIEENKNNNYGCKWDLSDAEYIEYHIWESVYSDKMYKKNLPNAHVLQGSNPNIIFHGGCLGCLSQRKHGIDRCKGCTYFKFSKKPNLFIPGEDSSKISGDDFKRFLTGDDEDGY